ncbi:MAG: hypothetical protein HYR97_02520, partial [Candidatus Melainabacteria bacterium]|nr:hypothetical protein [Candidatus Melainabacteria bacterium]
ESRGASSCSDSPNSCPAGEQCYPRTDGPDGCRCAPPPCDKCDDEKPVGFKKCSDDGSSVKQCKRHEFYHEQCSYQDIDLCNYNQFCEDALCKDKCTECSGRPLESTFCSFGNVVKKCKNDNNDDLCEEPTIEECGADKTCVQTSETTAECVPKCGNSQQDSGETCDSSAEPSGCGDNESCNDDCSGCTTTTTDSVDYSNSAPGL